MGMEIRFIKPKLNSLGKTPQDMRWCLKYAIEDAKKEDLKPDSKGYKDFVKKRAQELFKIHGEQAEELKGLD